MLGIVGVGTAGWMYYDAWATSESWNASPEAAALQRQQAEPTPVWIEPAATPIPVSSLNIAPVPTRSPPSAPMIAIVPTPVRTATADQLALQSTDFRFLDPPEPGAHARLAVAVTNRADVSSGRILLGIDAKWFDDYSIIGTGPAVSEDRTDDNGLRTFSFPPIEQHARATFELHVTATDEVTRAPSVQVLLDDGDAIGESAKPPTFAPLPRPGPVMGIDIPRLKLRTGVVQTAWEPPPFAVGQIKGTANISQGNTVLIGHLTGAAGNVFAHLDQLEPGDDVTATSRGLPYHFVVSQVFEGDNTDASPMQPEDDARLTLMTCAGIWNPFTHDYSQRLWVIAEPPEQAAVTIANANATATVVAATATAQATLDAEATATAIALEPTATPAPTLFAGEPSPAGGIGNTRPDVEKAYGVATGETSGRLVVFKPKGAEVRVRFSPDPQRAVLVSEQFSSPLSFDAAARDARKLLPADVQPRGNGPEGNSTLVVERFTSPHLAEVLLRDSGDLSVLYVKDAKGAISKVIYGLGDDFGSLVADASR